MNNFKKNDTEETYTLLTPELYFEILKNKSQEILELKTFQQEKIKVIESQLSFLKTLKEEIRNSKKSVRLCKRSLRKERRALNKINNKLVFNNQLVTEINDGFISEGESFIDLDRYKNSEPVYKKR